MLRIVHSGLELQCQAIIFPFSGHLWPFPDDWQRTYCITKYGNQMKTSSDSARNQLIDANCLRKSANVGRTTG